MSLYHPADDSHMHCDDWPRYMHYYNIWWWITYIFYLFSGMIIYTPGTITIQAEYNGLLLTCMLIVWWQLYCVHIDEIVNNILILHVLLWHVISSLNDVLYFEDRLVNKILYRFKYWLLHKILLSSRWALIRQYIMRSIILLGTGRSEIGRQFPTCLASPDFGRGSTFADAHCAGNEAVCKLRFIRSLNCGAIINSASFNTAVFISSML